MNPLRTLPPSLRSAVRTALLQLPLGPPRQPLFLLGCGRSGTTLLGRLLGAHPLLCFLNEPRQLWASCFPETDIWSPNPESRYARLLLDADSAIPDRQQKISRLFRFETLLAGRPLLVEKTPANNFRIPFLLALFPDCRFLYIERNGIAVARSIARQKDWYGEGHDYKWYQLVALARSRPETAALVFQCQNPFEKGLLEWRLSCQTAREQLLRLPASRFRFVHYEILLSRPVPVLDAIFSWLNIPSDSHPHSLAEQEIRSEPTTFSTSTDTPASPIEEELAGPLLKTHQQEVAYCQSNDVALLSTPLP